MSVFDREMSHQGAGRQTCLASHRSVITSNVPSPGVPTVFWLWLYGFTEWVIAPRGADH